jgi:cobalt/nickel transport system permease protein
MHIPDGFLSPPVWAALDVISVPVVGWAARKSRHADHTRIPLLGMMGAFVFAAQMINFPVGLGTSGHLLGGALLAIVLGPASAMITMTAILMLQALVFQDGGVLALGANVFNMALAGVLAGYLPVHVWGRNAVAIFAGGTLSVLVSAGLALGQLLVSGVPIPAQMAWGAAGLFLVSALIEGAITVAAVRAIERLTPGSMSVHVPRLRLAWIAAGGLLIVGGVWLASSYPDGLQSLASQLRLQESLVWSAPFADYQAVGAGPEWGRKAIASVIGMAAVYVIGAVMGRRAQ